MESQLRYTNNGRYFLTHTITRNRGKMSEDNKEKRNRNLNIGYKTNGISEITQKKIRNRCRILGYCAKEKEVKDYMGRIIKHKTTFITLTLPSKQIHEDKEITRLILGRFLDSCRKVGLLNNYVWKAEKQKNKNIHYHILTDSYANKTIVYRYWLIACNKLGYVDRYTDKFKGMSFQDYKKLEFNKDKSDVKVSGAFWKGNRNNWRLPPCYDTSNVNSDNSIEKYLSKYMCKEDRDSVNIVTGRTWGCSKNINEALEIFKNDKTFNEYGFMMAKYVVRNVGYIGKYFEIIFMEMSRFFAWFPAISNEMIARLRLLIIPCQFHAG